MWNLQGPHWVITDQNTLADKGAGRQTEALRQAALTSGQSENQQS